MEILLPIISYKGKGKISICCVLDISQALCQRLHKMLFHLLRALIGKLRLREVNNCLKSIIHLLSSGAGSFWTQGCTCDSNAPFCLSPGIITCELARPLKGASPRSTWLLHYLYCPFCYEWLKPVLGFILSHLQMICLNVLVNCASLEGCLGSPRV